MTLLGAEAHVLVIPFPAQGHMIPLLDLTGVLAARGLTITIVVTPKNLPLLTPLLSSHPKIQTLVLPFPPHPSIPSHVENCKDLPPHSFKAVIRALTDLHDPLLAWFHSHPSPPVAIISDMFLGWTHRLACRLGIERINFSPSGAMALSVMYYLWRYFPRTDVPREQTALISLDRLPNGPYFPWWQLSPLFRNYFEDDSDLEFLRDSFLANIESWGLVINSFGELERAYLDHLKKEMGHDRVWAVGPLLPSGEDPSGLSTQRGGSSSVSETEVKSWLDECKDGEVVYVCFGSQMVLRNDQMEGLAAGLERSGARFIWCVKEPTKGHAEGKFGRIPAGLEGRVADRGLVIKGWVPQVYILNHRAVGAFLTHCGWNSILEGLVAGVKMLTWPMGADQFSNASLLVDELKVAKRVCEGAQTVPDPEVVAETVVNVKAIESERALELSRAARKAIQVGGDSLKDLDGFVNRMLALDLRAK